MIERYTDHAANERTFLAWIRTSLALMALGCVLVKFELLLRLAGVPAELATSRHVQGVAVLGLAFIALAIVMLAGAYGRFRRIRLAIADPQLQPLSPVHLEASLTLIVAVLAAGLAWLLWSSGG